MEESLIKKIIAISLILLIIIFVGLLFFYRPGREIEQKPDFIESGEANILVIAIYEEDISICDLEENQINCRDKYYFYKTLIDKKNYCEEITCINLKEVCLGTYNQDYDCTKFGGNPKIICEAIFYDKIESCEKIDHDKDRVFCQGLGFIIKAIEEKDPDICDNIENRTDSEKCLHLVSISG